MTENGLRYFGPTSNLHFLSSIIWTRRPYIDILHKGRKAVENAGIEYEVPPEKRDHLLSIFWAWQNPFFAIVDKQLFLRDMKIFYSNQSANNQPSATPNPSRLVNPTPSVKYFSPVLLNSMLALASLLDDSYDGHPYHFKARILLDTELEEPQVTTVQAAVFLGIYEAMSDRDTLGWVFSGMAMRMAVDMGYHLDPKQWVEQGYLTEEEAQMRLKTFWGCFSAERMWSFCLGRPSCIRLNDIMAPRPTAGPKCAEDMDTWVPYVAPDVELPTVWKEYTALSQVNLTNVYLVKLAELMAEIQEVLFVCSESYTQAKLWDFASQMYVKLASWYTTLPPPLLCSPNSQKPVVAHIVLLHIQYHATIINLFKPFLHEELNEEMDTLSKDSTKNDPSVSSKNSTSNVAPSVLASSHSAELCRNSAFQISNLLSKYHHSWYSFRRVHPAAVQMTFSAATIHLNNAWNSVGIEKANATQALKICCEALASMGSAYEAAKRALSIITCLMNKGRHGFSNDKSLKTGYNTPNFTKLNSSRDSSTPPPSQVNLAQLQSSISNAFPQQDQNNEDQGVEEDTKPKAKSMESVPDVPMPANAAEEADATQKALQSIFDNSNTGSDQSTRNYQPEYPIAAPVTSGNPTTYAQGPTFHTEFQNILSTFGDSSKSASSNLASAHGSGFDLAKLYNDYAQNSVPLGGGGIHNLPVSETTWKPSLQRNLNRSRMMEIQNGGGQRLGFANDGMGYSEIIENESADNREGNGAVNRENSSSNENATTSSSLDGFAFDQTAGRASAFGDDSNFFSHPLGYNSTVPFFNSDDFFVYAKNMRNGGRVGGSGGHISAFPGNQVGEEGDSDMIYGQGSRTWGSSDRRTNRLPNSGVEDGSSEDKLDENMYCLLEENPRLSQNISNRVLYEYNLSRAQTYLDKLNQLASNPLDERVKSSASDARSKKQAVGSLDEARSSGPVPEVADTELEASSTHRKQDVGKGPESKYEKLNTQKVLSDLLMLTTPFSLNGNKQQEAEKEEDEEKKTDPWPTNPFTSSSHVLNTALSSLIGYDPMTHSQTDHVLNTPINPELSGTNEWRNFFQAVKKNNYDM